MCLCGMLATEYRTLPEPLQASVSAFFTHTGQSPPRPEPLSGIGTHTCVLGADPQV